jgi:hypothetical protein
VDSSQGAQSQNTPSATLMAVHAGSNSLFGSAQRRATPSGLLVVLASRITPSPSLLSLLHRFGRGIGAQAEIVHVPPLELRGHRIRHRFVRNRFAPEQRNPFPACRRIKTPLPERCGDGRSSLLRRLHCRRGIFLGAIEKVDSKRMQIPVAIPYFFNAFINVKENRTNGPLTDRVRYS